MLLLGPGFPNHPSFPFLQFPKRLLREPYTRTSSLTGKRIILLIASKCLKPLCSVFALCMAGSVSSKVFSELSTILYHSTLTFSCMMLCNITTYVCLVVCCFSTRLYAPWKQELSCFLYHCIPNVYISALTWKILHKLKKRFEVWALASKQPPLPFSLNTWNLNFYQKAQETGEIK